MKCWMCECETELDKGGLRPGEIHPDIFGDPICIYCEQKIVSAANLLAHPELIPVIVEINKLPKIAGLSIALHYEEET
jgi:hypothetical protein